MIERGKDEASQVWGDLRAAHRAASDEGRPAAIAKQHGRGSISARERIARFVDPGSFVEYGMLAGPLDPAVSAPADGVVTGVGTLEGRAAAILSYDYTVLGGSQGAHGHAKLERLFRTVEQLGCPLIAMIEGGGGRANESSEGRGNGMVDYILMARLSGRVPLIGVVFGRAFAGHAALAGLCDVVIARRSATMGIAGPPLVSAAIGQTLSPEEIGSAELHARVGTVDILVDDDEAALAAAATYLGLLSEKQRAFGKPIGCDEPLRALVPANLRRAYDIRKVVERLADPGTMLELRSGWARNIVTVLARIAGISVGIVANQPMHLGGAIDSPASDKAARFINLCDRFGLPLLMLVDTPGFLVGPGAEEQALIRHSSRLVLAMARFSGVAMSVLIRKAYGLAFWAMASRAFDPLLHIAWPTAEFGAMGLEGAAKLIAGPDAPPERIAQIVDDLREQGSPLTLAGRVMIDDVIDPAETRMLLARALRLQSSSPSGGSRLPLDSW